MNLGTKLTDEEIKDFIDYFEENREDLCCAMLVTNAGCLINGTGSELLTLLSLILRNLREHGIEDEAIDSAVRLSRLSDEEIDKAIKDEMKKFLADLELDKDSE